MSATLLIARLALRNLFARRLNLVIGGLMLLATVLLVVGSSVLWSIDQSMRNSFIDTITGHIELYSSQNPGELVIFSIDGPPAEIPPIRNVPQVKRALAQIDNIQAVVPLGMNESSFYGGNVFDVLLEQLRAELDSPSRDAADHAARVSRMKAHLRQASGFLAEDVEREAKLLDPQWVKADLENARRVSSDAFWTGFDADPKGAVAFLESQIAPLAPGDLDLHILSIGTNFQEFAQAFHRMKLVQGQLPPPGARGFLFSKYTYDENFELKNARRLDKIKDALERQHRTIEGDDELTRWVRENKEQLRDILFQLDPDSERAVVERLRRDLSDPKGDIRALLTRLFDTNDQNFRQRYALFYQDVAPELQLYRVRVGDSISLRATAKSGYTRSTKVKLYGTFEFQGLESAEIAKGICLMDLMTFRELDGLVTSAREQEELAALERSSGIVAQSREQIEKELLRGPQTVALASGSVDEGLAARVQARARAEAEGDSQESPEAVENGPALSAAVFLKNPARLDETLAQIRAVSGQEHLGIGATSWRRATGFFGQFTRVAGGVLSFAGLLIFLVMAVVINNSTMIVTVQRSREIGTLRAIGASRGFVRALVIGEVMGVALVFGSLGSAVGALLVHVLSRSGIPAANDFLAFFFAGSALHPTLLLAHVLVPMALVLVVSVMASLYPTRVALAVSPTEAMGTEA